MASADDVILALEVPAALIDSKGDLLSANPAFALAGAPVAGLSDLADGEGRETLAGDGALISWTARALADGARLVIGRAAGAGLDQRERYLASMSHELRTPLNGVLGMAGLLADTRLAADQRAYLATLQDCGEHLLGLVNDILDLARLNSGQLTLHPAPLAPKTLLQSTAELLSPKAHGKGLEIAWSAPDDLPTVLADEGRLRQVLFNLAGNAVKFADAGGVLLGVEARARTTDRITLRFTVTDTGPGVADADRDRIFEAFAQGGEHVGRSDSSGLGLAIVRRLAGAHAGSAGLESPPEGGARFWFEAAFAIAAPARRSRPLEGRTVIVVSGNAIVARAAAEQVASAGGLALVFDTVADAAQAPAPQDAVVLIDHALAPRGPRKPLAGRPSVILLAPEQRGSIARYRAGGFAGYLIKPLRDVSLIERVLAGSGAPAAPAPSPDERAAAGQVKARVLLAEDNPINAVLARSLLEREGCSVDRVASGEEAVAAGLSGAYDLIFMDQRMPGLSGREAARTLRERGCRTAIIALTADAFEEDRQACLAAGMDDFLTKPLEPATLRLMLRRWSRAGWTPAREKAKLAS
jgi:signal transduction histidine kinase/CheY-like chemotaxis protein